MIVQIIKLWTSWDQQMIGSCSWRVNNRPPKILFFYVILLHKTIIDILIYFYEVFGDYDGVHRLSLFKIIVTINT